jgi:hypothetical protein
MIFLLASIAFYFLIWYVMIRQVDEDLKIEQREIETYVSKYQRPPEPITSRISGFLLNQLVFGKNPSIQNDSVTRRKRAGKGQADQFYNAGRNQWLLLSF